ncbi:MAG: response regulator, partial [Chloroflexota bacterium]
MSQKRILIVDDEEAILSVLRGGLKKLGEGIQIVTTTDPRQAIEFVRESPFDLILTDYRMNQMDGLALIQSIRAIQPDARVILMTAYGTAELKNAVEGGLTAYLEKPFSVEEIRNIVFQALQSARRRGEQASPPSTNDPRIRQALNDLQGSTGARCVLLVNPSGFPMEIVGGLSAQNTHSVAALVAANFIAASELAKLVGNDSVFKSSYHEGAGYNIYSYDVNGSALLAVVFGAEAKPGAIWFYTKQTAADLQLLVKKEEPLTVPSPAQRE